MHGSIKKIIFDNNKLRIISCCHNNQNLQTCNYVSDGIKLYVAENEKSKLVQQILFNPKTLVSIGANDDIINIRAYASIIKKDKIKSEIIEDLSKKEDISHQAKSSIKIVEILPMEISYLKNNYTQVFPENQPSFVKELSSTLKSSIKLWLKATAAQFLVASTLPVIFGSVFALYFSGSFNWLFFILTLLGITCIHAGTNLINDAFDVETDSINRYVTPFSGGRGTIQGGLFSRSKVFISGIIFLIIGSVIGLYLNFSLDNNIILYIGIAGVIVAFFYVVGPIKFAYRGVGEIFLFIGFGPLLVIGSFYVQTSDFSWVSFYVSIPVGLLVVSILHINQFPDYEADKEVGKNNWVVLMGRSASRYVYLLIILGVYISLVVLIAKGVLPLLSLLTLIVTPLIIKANIILFRYYNKPFKLIPALALTIFHMISFIMLLTISVILAFYI